MPAVELTGITSRQLDILRNGLRIMALHALGDADAAEDVVQESLLRALNALTREIAADPVRLGAFTGGIARHVIADLRRRDSRFAELSDNLTTDGAGNVLDQIVNAEQCERVRVALERLPAADRTILHASFFDGLTPAQIAAQMQHPPEVIRKRKSRALARLRQLFPQNGHAEAAAPSKRKTTIGVVVPAESAS